MAVSETPICNLIIYSNNRWRTVNILVKSSKLKPNDCYCNSFVRSSLVAAMVLGNEPNLTPSELMERLVSTNKNLFPFEWANAEEIGGVDAYAAVTGGAP